MGKRTILLLMFLAMWCDAAEVELPLKKILSVKHLSYEQASYGMPVEIAAQVTFLHPRQAGIILFDGKVGIYVHLQVFAGDVENLKVGSLVKIQGKTSDGGYVPDITADRVEVTGWSPLPKPRNLYHWELSSSKKEIDCELVTLQGRIVSATALEKYDHVVLGLEIHDRKVDLHMPYSEGILEEIEPYMFQRAHFPAVTGTVYNRHRQMTERIFFVNSPDAFALYHEDKLWRNTDVRAIETLMHAGTNNEKAVLTRGTVTYAEETMVYLRGSESCLMSATLGKKKLIPGDYVELRGFIWPQPISPAFRAKEVEHIDKRPPPSPRIVDVNDELKPDWNYDLISTSATLVEIGKSFGVSSYSGTENSKKSTGEQRSLLCRSGERLFEARLPPGAVLPEEVKPGAALQLTGICRLVANRDPRWKHFTEDLWMDLRRENGVVVLQKAPWWTTKRLFFVVVAVLGISLLLLVWVAALRKIVVRQTAVIGEQIKKESMLEERQRIARDLHDTLEQSLAAVALQLKSCFKQVKQRNLEKSEESLRLAQGMMRHCRQESRGSIIDLRGGLLEKMNLPDAIQETMKELILRSGIKFNINVNGKPRRLRQFVELQMMRIAKEAVNNAVKHASPSEITVTLKYAKNCIELIIADDGAGFNVDRLSRRGRFGLQGMEERADRINGEFIVETEVGRGTEISVKLASTDEWELG